MGKKKQKIHHTWDISKKQVLDNYQAYVLVFWLIGYNQTDHQIQMLQYYDNQWDSKIWATFDDEHSGPQQKWITTFYPIRILSHPDQGFVKTEDIEIVSFTA